MWNYYLNIHNSYDQKSRVFWQSFEQKMWLKQSRYSFSLLYNHHVPFVWRLFMRVAHRKRLEKTRICHSETNQIYCSWEICIPSWWSSIVVLNVKNTHNWMDVLFLQKIILIFMRPNVFFHHWKLFVNTHRKMRLKVTHVQMGIVEMMHIDSFDSQDINLQ